jgi:hypothetical protein
MTVPGFFTPTCGDCPEPKSCDTGVTSICYILNLPCNFHLLTIVRPGSSCPWVGPRTASGPTTRTPRAAPLGGPSGASSMPRPIPRLTPRRHRTGRWPDPPFLSSRPTPQPQSPAGTVAIGTIPIATICPRRIGGPGSLRRGDWSFSSRTCSSPGTHNGRRDQSHVSQLLDLERRALSAGASTPCRVRWAGRLL